MWVSKTAYLPVPYLPPACKNIATALQELPGCLRRLDLAANLLSREGLLAAYGPAFLARYADQQASLRAWRPTPHRAELQDHAPQEEEDNRLYRSDNSYKQDPNVSTASVHTPHIFLSLLTSLM